MTLDELVKEALLTGTTRKPVPVSLNDPQNPEPGTDISGGDILVIGIGTAGTKIISCLHRLAGPGLRTLVIDSNRESLEASSASSMFYLKPTYFSGGFGLCGGDPDLFERYTTAMEMAKTDIEHRPRNPEFCFIVAGLGGNMGTGATPVIARMMRDRGAIVTAVVSHPFSVERKRIQRAARGIEELSKIANTTLILDFEKLGSALPKEMVFPHQYAVMDHILAVAVLNFWEGTKFNSFVAFTTDDLHYMLERGGIGTLLLGEFGPASGKKILPDEMRVPLLDFSYEAAKGCIIHITGGYDLGLFESDQIVTSLSELFNLHTDVIWAATVKKEMEGKLRLFTVVTGLRR